MTFSASPYSDPIQIKAAMEQGMDQPEMLWVMGPVLAVIVIIIIVIAILLFKKYDFLLMFMFYFFLVWG